MNPKNVSSVLPCRRWLLVTLSLSLVLVFLIDHPFSQTREDCTQQAPVLEIFPSPLHMGGQLHARFIWCEADPAILKVYNVSWSPAAKKKVTTVVGENLLDLELHGFTAGVYYAYLEIDHGTVKQRSSLVKFVVLR